MKKAVFAFLFFALLGPLANAKSLQISTLERHHREGLVFETDAFVVFQYVCPPCPVGAVCKPCMRDSVIISEEKELKKSYQEVNSRDMIVFTQGSPKLELGKRYRFEIKFLRLSRSVDKRTLYEGELLGFQPL